VEVGRKLGERFALCGDLLRFAAQDDAIDSQAFDRLDGITVVNMLRLFVGELQAGSRIDFDSDSAVIVDMFDGGETA
jgi:hypothetical protein